MLDVMFGLGGILLWNNCLVLYNAHQQCQPSQISKSTSSFISCRTSSLLSRIQLPIILIRNHGQSKTDQASCKQPDSTITPVHWDLWNARISRNSPDPVEPHPITSPSNGVNHIHPVNKPYSILGHHPINKQYSIDHQHSIKLGH
ncbi:hypothetical protein KEM48_003278 [Puccinia striiformis f. sp. tritici PST-130]|nr:hypothetical protein KEM48_003278 [Puccinia striiformis f. sp. tritici PST-130]